MDLDPGPLDHHVARVCSTTADDQAVDSALLEFSSHVTARHGQGDCSRERRAKDKCQPVRQRKICSSQRAGHQTDQALRIERFSDLSLLVEKRRAQSAPTYEVAQLRDRRLKVIYGPFGEVN